MALIRAATPRFWVQRTWISYLLWPLSFLFGRLACLRRQAYRVGALETVRLPAQVIVVGNIAAGGSGKTPAVAWLVGVLCQAGWRPGIVSRGYGGEFSGIAPVPKEGDPHFYGDEPVLLARMTGCPVVVGRDRVAAARALLHEYPECNVVVTDDGMQHYRLERDVEIAVVDLATLGNRWYLPAGPLREPLSRLHGVDIVLAHGTETLPVALEPGQVYPMRLVGSLFHALNGTAVCDGSAWEGSVVHAIAGIGQPERFFLQLEGMGLKVVRHPFPDHHDFVPADLDFAPGEPKVMTSKDAVKCQAFAPDNTWVLPVQAQIGAGAAQRILEKLRHGSAII